jgi:glyoxylase-like metal-dependent hydrolase (beta-lactamase superfamily II)/8-oxo-dGTP pyrophosphatase MutT (NUDIX family)
LSTIAEAASVLLVRAPGSREILLVGRAPGLRFMGGFHAFPGGKVHTSDAVLAAGPGLSARHVAAVRELFEETGVLLARREDGTYPTAGEALAEARRELLAERVEFAAVLARLGLRLRADDLMPTANLVTPAFAPVRFDTAFFVATLPPGQQAEVWPGELTDGSWQSAGDALDAWTAGRVLLSPPTVSLLEVIRDRAVADLPARFGPVQGRLDAGGLPPIWFSPAVQMVPLRTCALPPSTHTNAWLVGTGPMYLLDPGPDDPAEQGRLFEALDEAAAAGRRLSAVVLTHHHPDHIGAAAACARRYGVPVRGHPRTAQLLAGKVEVRGDLGDGDRLDLGPAPDGTGRWDLRTVFTPGHAEDHLAFFEPHYRLLFAGDVVSTMSSVIVGPPGGDLAAYLDSLRRLQALQARLLLPAHGGPSARPAFVLDECLAHRLQREQQLCELLGDGPQSVADLAAVIYPGLPAPMMRFAEMQVLGGLLKLQREGRAAPAAGPGGAWKRT